MTYGELISLAGGPIRRAMAEHAPEEACGLVWSDGTISVLPNLALDPASEFYVPFREIERVQSTDLSRVPVAFFHTHPQGPPAPSPADFHQLRVIAHSSPRPVSLICGESGEIRAWSWDDGPCEVPL